MKKQIPNLLTLCNLVCGTLAAYMAALGWLHRAALLMLAGILFDFLDGFAARLLKVQSPMGKELDSLADVVTSGVAPGVILMTILWDNPIGRWLAFLALLMPLFAAYRLAKFNIDTRQSHSFLGLPTPANALIWVGVALTPALPMDSHAITIILIILSLVTNILMVSEMPMFSLKVDFKEMGWKRNSVQYLFLIGCAAIIAVSRQWYAISLIILWYIILSAITQKKHAE